MLLTFSFKFEVHHFLDSKEAFLRRRQRLSGLRSRGAAVGEGYGGG